MSGRIVPEADALTRDPLTRDLRALTGQVVELGGLAETLVEQALEAVIKRDAAISAAMALRADRVLPLEAAIDRAAHTLLAWRRPFGAELQAVIGAIRVASHLERVASNATAIAARAGALAAAAVPPSFALIPQLGAPVLDMVKDALDAYTGTSGTDRARVTDIAQRLDGVERLSASLIADTLKVMASVPRLVEPGFHVIMIARSLERIGDHAAGIARTLAGWEPAPPAPPSPVSSERP